MYDHFSREVVPVMLEVPTSTLCATPYYGHPKGCPNFGNKLGCPPMRVSFWDIADNTKPVYVIWNGFDLRSHVNNMARLHPDWTEAQLYCCLYWQGKARKQLKERVTLALEELEVGYFPIDTPEALGVNVSATMDSIGVILEWPPKVTAYQVALLIQPKR